MSPNLKVSDYLHSRNNATNRGTCSKCTKQVYWAIANIASHKRSNCSITAEEKKFWNDLKQRAVTEVVVVSSPTEKSPNVTSSSTPKTSMLAKFVDNITESVIRAANKALAKLFFRCAIPFRVVESAAFKEFIKILRPSFVQHLVSANTLSSRYLDEEYNDGMLKIKKIIAESDGFVIVSDGWSNVNRQHLVSFIIYVKGHKPFFYKIIDTSSYYMNAEKNAEIIIAVALELDINKWLAVITDNAPVLQRAWEIIEEKYPRVFASGCVAHGFNSFLNDVYKKSPKLQERLSDSHFIIKQIRNHTRINETFDQIKKTHSIGCRLQMPVATRFSSEFISAESVLKNKGTFVYLVSEYEELLKEVLKSDVCTKLLEIINSSIFWSELRFIVKDLFAKPSEVIRIVEGDSVNIGIVYSLCLETKRDLEKLRHETLFDHAQVLELFEDRWAKLSFESFSFAHILNPINLVKDEMQTDDYLRGVRALKDYIRKFHASDLGKSNATLVELGRYFQTFRGKTVDFVVNSFEEDPSTFWAVFGAKMFPHLTIISSRLFTIVPSSAASERGWNVFSTIHTKKRNRLSNEKVEKIAFVYINAALLDELDTLDYGNNLIDDFEKEFEGELDSEDEVVEIADNED